jgi:hypothetical protein
MTDAGIPMGEGREQRAREVLATEYAKIGRTVGSVADRDAAAIRAILAFADTPPPAAAGDRELAEALAASQRILRSRFIGTGTIGSTCNLCGDGWQNGREESHKPECQIALNEAALRTPEPDSGGKAS